MGTTLPRGYMIVLIIIFLVPAFYFGSIFLFRTADTSSTVDVVTNIERYTVSATEEQLNLGLSADKRQINLLVLDKPHEVQSNIKNKIESFVETNYKNVTLKDVTINITQGTYTKNSDSYYSQTKTPSATVTVKGVINNAGVAVNYTNSVENDFEFKITVTLDQLSVTSNKDYRDDKPIIESYITSNGTTGNSTHNLSDSINSGLNTQTGRFDTSNSTH